MVVTTTQEEARVNLKHPAKPEMCVILIEFFKTTVFRNLSTSVCFTTDLPLTVVVRTLIVLQNSYHSFPRDSPLLRGKLSTLGKGTDEDNPSPKQRSF
jgi:hypothetical protein